MIGHRFSPCVSIWQLYPYGDFFQPAGGTVACRPPHNILVYPCESDTGLELLRSLRFCPQFVLHGCSIGSDRGGIFYDNHLGSLPDLDSSDFLSELTAIIREYRIDFVFPASDDAMFHMSAWADDGLLDSEVMAPAPDMCRVCRSHAATFAFFSGKLAVPRQFRLEELGDADFPVFIKVNDGSTDGLVAVDLLQARDILRLSPFASIFEYLPGTEYTIDCFTDGAGSLLFFSGRERRLVVNNRNIEARLAVNPIFRKFADTINVEMRLQGAWHFLLKEDRYNKLRLLEVRSRLGYGSGLQRAQGGQSRDAVPV